MISFPTILLALLFPSFVMIYASYQDWKQLEVDNKLWIINILLGIFYFAFLWYSGKLETFHLVSFLTILFISTFFIYFRFGFADVKAILTTTFFIHPAYILFYIILSLSLSIPTVIYHHYILKRGKLPFIPFIAGAFIVTQILTLGVLL